MYIAFLILFSLLLVWVFVDKLIATINQNNNQTSAEQLAAQITEREANIERAVFDYFKLRLDNMGDPKTGASYLGLCTEMIHQVQDNVKRVNDVKAEQKQEREDKQEQQAQKRAENVHPIGGKTKYPPIDLSDDEDLNI